MAKKLSNEDKLVAIFQYGSLESAEQALALASAIVKQRRAAENPPVQRKRKKSNQETTPPWKNPDGN